MMAKLEINSGWTVIKLAYYLYLCVAMTACLQTSENYDKNLVRKTQGCQQSAGHELQSW